MASLHASGGVPAGWQLTPPAGTVEAGRLAFDDLGCSSCHAVAGETFAHGTAGVGPALTGMGGHHPAGYFVESILAPDAVLVEGDGYIDAAVHSTMPDYPDLTARQLGDLVAYLQSLRIGEAMPTATTAPVVERPAAPASKGKAFLIQTFDVRPGRLEELERWMQGDGGKRLREHGVLSVDTYVDFTRERQRYTSVFAFADGVALHAYAQNPLASALDEEFDALVSEHEHNQQMWAPAYRASSLSFP
jgi:mono/diheme cytochrome c family protein